MPLQGLSWMELDTKAVTFASAPDPAPISGSEHSHGANPLSPCALSATGATWKPRKGQSQKLLEPPSVCAPWRPPEGVLFAKSPDSQNDGKGHTI